MLYGEEKYREMSRSILPSTRRKWARREKSATKRHHRRQISQKLRGIRCEEDFELISEDLTYYPDGEINWIVAQRRDGDKINHFGRWAQHMVVDPGDPGANIANLRAVLPKNLIGDHALGHVRGFVPGYIIDDEPSYLRRFGSRSRLITKGMFGSLPQARCREIQGLSRRDPLLMHNKIVGFEEHAVLDASGEFLFRELRPVRKELYYEFPKEATSTRPSELWAWFEDRKLGNHQTYKYYIDTCETPRVYNNFEYIKKPKVKTTVSRVLSPSYSYNHTSFIASVLGEHFFPEEARKRWWSATMTEEGIRIY